MAEQAPFDPDATLKEAMRLHAAGKLDEAAELYRELLRYFPSHTDLLNILGTLELQRGNANKAALLLARSLGISPAQPTVLRHRALALQSLGRLEDALNCYDKAIALDPGDVETMQKRGQLLLALNRGAEARKAFETIAAALPGRADSHYNLATVLLRLGRAEEALPCFDKAIAIAPDEPNIRINRGTALLTLNRPAEALQDFETALTQVPECAEAYANKGEALRRLKRHDEALAAYDRAVQLAPDDAENRYNRGIVRYDLGRKEQALEDFDAAIARNPRMGAAYNNRGNALIDLDRLDEALASLDRAIALGPQNAEAFTNRGNVLRALNRHKEALLSYDRAIAANPDYAEAYANKSVALLHQGLYAEGWKLYEWRWKCDQPHRPILNFSPQTVRQFRQAQWQGEPLNGRTLLIHAEQGLGDILQFCRYIPQVYAKGGHIVVEAPQALLPLLNTLKGQYVFIGTGETPPDFDLHCPIMSLPLAFATTLETVPDEVPYLFVDPAKRQEWQKRLGPKTGSRIGVAWSGNPKHTDDRHRSIALSQLSPLFELPFEFHAIQKDLRPADAEVLARIPNLRHYGDDLRDFSDTAALIDEMDLVISVDTSAAHLAGALGKPLWLLLTWVSEWRWLIDCTDTPWYPTAELFRQPKRDDWAGVAAILTERLKALM